MLLFFDIDGTLFDSKRRLPATVVPALEQARKNGHILFVNTGRTLCNMREERITSLPFDGQVMGCGTRIVYRGETVQAMEMDPERSLGLLTLFREMKLPAVYECDTAMYFDPEGAGYPAIAGFREFAVQHGICRDIREGDPEFRIVKMFAFSDEPEAIRDMEARTAAFGTPFAAVDRGRGGWEVIPAGYTKATGMDAVCRMLGMEIRDTAAFGDSSNDETMLRHAGISVAMGNAPEELKKICTHTADLPERDGIAKMMKKLGLI
jgi:hypothetical protein